MGLLSEAEQEALQARKRRPVPLDAVPDRETQMGWLLTLAADRGRAEERAMQAMLAGEDRLPKSGGMSSDDKAKGKQHHATRTATRGKARGKRRPVKKASK